MSTDPINRRFGLDILRATAISLVLASHLANNLEVLGYYGVELFFVLSGFLIGGILLRGVERKERFGFFDLCEFLSRRWYRTLPNYYLFLFLFIANQYWNPIDGRFSWSGFPRYLFFMQNFAWARPSFYGVSWSLCVEEWFYLLTSFTLFAVLPFFSASRSGRLNAVLATAGLYVLVPLVLRFWWMPDPAVVDGRMIVVLRLDAIMFGVLMSAVKFHFPNMWSRPMILLATGIAGFASCAVFADRATPLGSALSLTLIPLSFSFLLAFFDRIPACGGRLAASIERVSVWSYSIYLIHMLIYSGMKVLVHYDALSVTQKLVYKLGCLVLIVVLSALNYRWFEKPLTDLRDRKRLKEADSPLALLPTTSTERV